MELENENTISVPDPTDVRVTNDGTPFMDYVREWWSDGKLFYNDMGDGSPVGAGLNERQMRRRLVHFGVCDKKPRGQPTSEVDAIIALIEIHRGVQGACELPLFPAPIVEHEGARLLNTSMVSPVTPLQYNQGMPPATKEFLEGFFEPESLRFFLAWMARFYKGAVARQPTRGQCLFIAGPPGTGKNMIAEVLIGGLVGGGADASDVLITGSQYTDTIMRKPVWWIHDAHVSEYAKVAYTTRMKQAVANNTFSYNAKYGARFEAPWKGRLVITCNEDPASMSAAPDTDSGTLDKSSFLRVKPGAPLPRPVLLRRIREELRGFAAWLMSHEDKDLPTDPRLGIKSYHDPFVLENAHAGSPLRMVSEALELWRMEQFAAPKPLGLTEFDTRLSAIVKDLMEEGICSRMTPGNLNRDIMRAMKIGVVPWLKRGNGAEIKVTRN